jgi:hypothetical protein
VSDDAPSVSRIAGQLGYLFEEEPDLRDAAAQQLADRLNREDRYARARQQYVLESDDVVRDHIDEFPARITAALVEEARARVR